MNYITHIPERKQIIITINTDEGYIICKNVLPEFLNYYGFNVIERNILKTEVNELDVSEKNIIKIKRIINKWYCGEFTQFEKKTKRYRELKEEGIIPIQYIQQRCATQLKDVNLLKSVIQTLVLQGDLINVSYMEREKLCSKYKWSRFDAQAFRKGKDFKFP